MGTITIDGKIYEYASASIVTGPGEPPIPAPPTPEPPAPPAPPVSGPCPPDLAIIDTVLDASNASTNIIIPSGKGSGHVFKFTTPEANTVYTINAAEFSGYSSVKTAVVSQRHCDFNLNSPTAIDRTVQQRPSFMFSVGFSSPGYTRLEPDTTYYMNLKHEDLNGNPTCPEGTSCQFIVVHSVSR